MEKRFVLGLLLAGLTAVFLAPRTSSSAEDEITAADDDLLKKGGVVTDGPGLLAYFRIQTAPEEERRKLVTGLVRQLRNKSFKERKKAENELVKLGPMSVPFLKTILKDPDIEIRTRAQVCIKKIESGPGPALPAAAARLLALRRPAGAMAALLDFVPFAQDEWLQEEVLANMGRLALPQGRVDPVLAGALKDKLPFRRAAAGYVLARVGNPRVRALVRPLLADSDALVRRRAAQGLIGKLGLFEESTEADEAFLKINHVETDAAGLTTFFRKRSLSAEDQQRLQDLVRQLGDLSFKKRQQASRELILAGTAALPFLNPALKDQDVEIVKRAEECLAKIAGGPGTALPIAAIRLLVKRAPADAVKMLLTYVPSADDGDVEEAVLTGLCALLVREIKLDPALRTALQDPAPARRAAAAYVLARVGFLEDCQAARRLLGDRDAKVRLRAAQGLLYAKQKAAVPVLLELLDQSAQEMVPWKAEELLRQLAQDKAPDLSIAELSAEARKKARAAWADWWRDQGNKVDLARLNQDGAQLGLTVICEFDSTRGGSGQAWEFGRDFKPRWKIQNLQGPMDAHILPGNKVLIVEYYASRVTERDLKGNIQWEHKVANYPVACQRLPGGNTFVATYSSVLEITKDHKEVYNHNRGADGQIYSAQKIRNGHVVYMTNTGNVVEFDPRANRVIKRFNVGNPGAWCGVEWLPSGRFLVSLMVSGKIMELDASGKSHWEATVTGAHQTLRLANGHILVVCMNNKRLVEIDRSGKILWEKPMEGRPWRVHRR